MAPLRTHRRHDIYHEAEQRNYEDDNHKSNAIKPHDDSDVLLPPAMQANSATHSILSSTNAELNLSVLQRHNPSISNVLSIAPYAVIYIFTDTLQAWEKTGIEGTLFVCQLAVDSAFEDPGLENEERYIVIVLNRRGLENFQIELGSREDVEIADEYIILQHLDRQTQPHALDGRNNDDMPRGSPIIYGLWIFAEPYPSSTADMRVINAKVIQDCALRAETSRNSIEERRKKHLQEAVTWHADHPVQTQQAVDHVSGQHMAFERPDSRIIIQSTEHGFQESSRDVLGDLFEKARQEHSANR